MSGISITATNPCHLYDMARALHDRQALGTYYSGYPRWKLRASQSMRIQSFPLRTLGVYGLLRYVKPGLRPNDQTLFKWQDEHFDRSVAKALKPSKAIHAMPGQCLETFRAAKRLGMQTVLNHATGPTAQMGEALDSEYRRIGMKFDQATGFDSTYRAREDREYELADYHCVASTIVANQLESSGIGKDRIWIVPYACDESVSIVKSLLAIRTPSLESSLPASSLSGKDYAFC